MSSPRLQEAKHAGTSSKLGKLHIGARPVVQMIPVFSAVDATILQIILGIWCTLAYPWAIVAVAIAEIQRHGDFLYIVRYTQPTKMDHKARERERRQISHRSSSRLYE
jgi:hypothetical protein